MLSRDEPRRNDLPDLSTFTSRVASPPSSTAQRPTGAGLGTAAAATQARMPPSYQAFLTQAQHVQRRLRKVGEGEAASVRAATPMARADETTRVFAAAAERHREQLRS
jgi:hypothetical protein